ncbi:hypothetical protein [Nonomuraea jabiensis]|uniref:hypothetical protein n=1 Tax=Nonomuraea jabiensis TaxID=882448 RepID=UPI003D707FCF
MLVDEHGAVVVMPHACIEVRQARVGLGSERVSGVPEIVEMQVAKSYLLERFRPLALRRKLPPRKNAPRLPRNNKASSAWST